MTIAKIGVGSVVDEREEERNESERNCIEIAAEKKKGDPKKCGERDGRVKKEDAADEDGVRRKKIVPGRFGAEPGGGNAAPDEAGFKSGMRADEVASEAALFVHKGGFAELRVETGFAEARDALDAADGVFVEDVIVAQPEFERKI